MAYNYGEPNPIGFDQVGYKTTRVILEVKDYLFTYLYKVDRIIKNTNGFTSEGSAMFICLDKNQKKAFLMKDIYNDFTGSHMQSSDIQAQPDGIFTIGFQAVDLKEMAEKALADPKTPSDIRQRMQKINAEIKADNNPVLIVGKLKTK
jgi:hypothetical protein